MTLLLQEETKVRETVQSIVETVKSLSEETIRWNPTEDEWSIMQIVTHLTEALPYWVNEIQQILQDPELAWGRGLVEETRLKAVSDENVQSLSVAEVLSKLEKVPAVVENGLSSLSEEQLNLVAPSRNPRFDGKPVNFIVNHLIVEHVEKHYGQIQRNLSKLPK